MTSEPNRGDSGQWFWSALIWSGIALFDATQTVLAMRAEGMHHNWMQLFVTVLLSWLPWLLVTPTILRLSRSYPASRLDVPSFWLVHLFTCMAIGLASSAWMAWLENLLNPWGKLPAAQPFLRLWLQKFYNGLLLFLMLYGFILVVAYVLGSRARLARQETEAARLNEQLSKMQLDSLRRQIEPHFLFNTLNAIAGLVREQKNDQAVSMIAGLSDFLRHVLRDSNKQEVPLEEELAFTQKYLDIQKVRFAERLHVTIDVSSELFSVQVPSLILQPMVENAVKHGIAKRTHGGEIRIAAARCNGLLALSVYNDGPSMPADWETRESGIGIRNVRTRLQSLYGKSFQLTIRNQEPGGVEATVCLPVREK
jgi:two-component system, LytTR family, sensor kinase